MGQALTKKIRGEQRRKASTKEREVLISSQRAQEEFTGNSEGKDGEKKNQRGKKKHKKSQLARTINTRKEERKEQERRVLREERERRRKEGKNNQKAKESVEERKKADTNGLRERARRSWPWPSAISARVPPHKGQGRPKKERRAQTGKASLRGARTEQTNTRESKKRKSTGGSQARREEN